MNATGYGKSFLALFLGEIEKPAAKIAFTRLKCHGVSNETCVPESLDSYNGKFIVVMAPDFACCQCGNRLKAHFGGLCTSILPYPYPFIFSVCESCQSAGFKELASGGNQVRLISPTAFRALLDDEDRILGFAQASLRGNGVLLEPYPIRGK